MSKIGNFRSNGYGDGNLHTYDGKSAKPKKTLADVRKARELAQKKARQAKQVQKAAVQTKQRVEQTFGQRTQLSPSVIDHNLGLDRTPKSAQESFGVFAKHDVSQALSQRTSLSPSVIDHNLGLDRIPKSAQESFGVFAKHDVSQALSQKTSLSPSVIDHNLGLDRTPKSAQESFGVFAKHEVSQALSQRTPLSPSVIDHNLGLDRAAKSAQESAEAFKAGNIVRQHTIPASQGLQEFTDNMLGIGRTPKSAQESMGVFVKREVEQALSQKTPLNPSIIDNNLGLSRSAKSAQESASAFIEHGLTDTEKALEKTTKESKGIWGSVKGLFGKAKKALSSGWTKFKSFAKTPKGKWSLAAAAVVVVAAGIWAYVADRFSAKNIPPTTGPSKAFMPKLETEEDDDIPEIETEVIEETDDKKVDEEETETDSTKVVPAPVPTDTHDETDKVDETDKTDETKTPATEEEKKEAEEVAKANDAENKRNPGKIDGDEYEVVKGDCVWNIAKAHLKELNKDKADYTPSNVEILRHTKELMEINDLHYEADNYVVIIKPGQKLKIKK